MRCLLLAGLLLTGAVSVPVLAGEAKEGKSALEADPAGWVDLLAAKDLKGWKRVPIPPGSQLRERSPWRLDAAGGRLVCDGVGVHEMLLFDRELGDGILHVEWRFEKVEGKKGYNSGVYVRNSADGRIWHQAQVGSKNVGYLFGLTRVEGEEKRFRIAQKGPQRGREAGEWNTFEITCRGPNITLWVNGAVTAEWADCRVPRGYVGLEAEGFLIEFKNVKYKELK
jgi:hypothetical protein